MYTIAVTLLLGLALLTLVGVAEDLLPDLARRRGLVTAAAGIAAAFAVDYSLFPGLDATLREAWMGTAATGLALAGAAVAWRATLGWLGASGGDEPAARHRPARPVGRAA